MLNRDNLRALRFFVTAWIVLIVAPVALAQSVGLRIDYTVAVKSTAANLFHVTADVKNIRQPSVDFSLPVWTPGWYTIENYAKNILRFHVTDEKGARLPHSMVRKQTWRVDTKGRGRIKIEFDYRADVLALNQAEIRDDFAFFTGTQLFLQAEGHRNSPSSVRFEVPQGWKVVTALKETNDPMTFTAADYDTLVDSPTHMGKFDLATFEIDGKPHYFTAAPAGVFAKEKIDQFKEILIRIAKTQAAIFGGLPYEKYVYFYFFSRPESNAGGALEHANSYVAFAPPSPSVTPQMLAGTAAHEFFHLWNVKRIRPAEMWPYDYSRENESPLLWLSEGFTNYYTMVTLLRAGLTGTEEFLERAAGVISAIESNEVRSYVSPADASTSTWLGYDTPVAFGISYYTQGQNIGALLDLSILRDTGGARRLDDVFRALYTSFYQKGKGFSTEEFINVVNDVTKRDYHDFYRRYIGGVEVPPYDTILGYAGYRLEKSSQKVPMLGIEMDVKPEGTQVLRVSPDSSAASAGLRAGDILLAIDEVEVRRGFRGVYERLVEKIDQPVKLSVKRDGKDQTLTMKVAGREEMRYRIVELPEPTAEQMKVREAWLKR
jgi:predicted metalloprotease with PDZ domain